jgi:hypothetical protein
MSERVWTKDEIRERLLSSDQWVRRAVVTIYGLQTSDEQDSQTTTHVNSVGYSGADAEIMSSFAVQIGRGWLLSAKQMAIARRKFVKYAGQLAKVANKEL